MQFTYYGHACFAVEVQGKTLLFDPFISGNELAKDIQISEIKADYILVSHGHADHIADCVSIAQQTGALVICSWEIAGWLNNQGVSNTHPMNTGGKRSFDFGSVKCVVAHHSSGLPDGSYGGNPMGFIISSTDGDFYYSGDTALTLDMQLLPRWGKPKFAVLPIGDNFTMGPEDALRAVRLLRPKVVIPMHYSTWGVIQQDAAGWVERVNRETSVHALLLQPGESYTLS